MEGLDAVAGLPLEIRESQRARRLRLEVRPGVLRLTLPRGCPPEEAVRFVDAQARWIAARTQAWTALAPPGEGPVDPPFPGPEGRPGAPEGRPGVPEGRPGAPEGLPDGGPVAPEDGPGASESGRGPSAGRSGASDPRHIVFRGRRTPFRVHLTQAGRPRVGWSPEGGVRIHLPARWPEEAREPRGRRALSRWYDTLLREEALAAIEAVGRPRGLVPTEIRFSQPRTRWGSCAHDGVVRLNRRLVGAPAPVFRYVVLHEIAHLRHRDHSPRFWALVEAMDPAWREHRRWLAQQGPALG